MLGRGRWLVLLLVTFVALGPFARTTFAHGNGVWKEYSYLGGMDAIALGCLTAILTSRRHLSCRMVFACTGSGVALLIFCLGFTPQMERLGLEKTGLGMTALAIGACMLIAAAAQTRWRAPRVVSPLLAYGRRSYEVYLTHMFVVFAFFNLFVMAGKPLWLVTFLFIVVIVLSGAVGGLVARFYSEPANRWLRSRFGAQTDLGMCPLKSANT